MEYLELEKVVRERDGWVVVAPGVAGLGDAGKWMWGTGEEVEESERGNGLRVSIVAVLVKGDGRVRWFYTLFPVSKLLEYLDERDLVEVQSVLEPGRSSYKFSRMHTWIRESFLRAIRVPDSPDWVHAIGITDFCPSILDPEGALGRLEEEAWLGWNAAKAEEYLFPSTTATGLGMGKEKAKDKDKDKPPQQDFSTLTFLDGPSDDRYLHHLHPAERELASLARLKCAEYLFIKRTFFRAFWEEVYRSGKIADVAAPAASTSNPVRSRRSDPQHAIGQQEVAGRVAVGDGRGRQDTPFSATTATPAPDGASGPPGATGTGIATSTGTGAGAGGRGRGRRVGNDRARRNRVRTEHAHQVWLENEHKFKTTQAKTLVVGWRVLGFLDESRYLGWVREGWGADDEVGEVG